MELLTNDSAYGMIVLQQGNKIIFPKNSVIYDGGIFIMGMFAGAVFIRNEQQLTKEQLIEKFTEYMQSKGYEACDSEEANLSNSK